MNIHEETLKIARNLIKKDPSLTDWVISKFPELKESKDEKIRKVIRGWIYTRPTSFFDNGISKEEILDWLEKQGEHANFLSKIQVDDKVTRNEAGIGDGQLDRVAKQYNITGIGSKNAQGKLGEMIKNLKPADKVGPKFKVGDWIVQNGLGTYKIVEVCESWYEVISYKDGIQYSIGFDKENDCHLWTIQDAKNGDVLASELCDSIILFRGIKGDNIDFYCDYDFSKIDIPEDRFAVNNGQHYGNVEDSKDFHPATKEQRDTLFTKMKESGYEWNDEKKELKKIEFNPDDLIEESYKQQADDLIDMVTEKSAWSEEDENNYKHILEILSDCYVYGRYDLGMNEHAALKYWLKSLRPKSWTKEDKERYISCLKRLGTGNPDQPETSNSKWFKEHVYPQPKQEFKWDEEDNNYIDNCCLLIGAVDDTYDKIFKDNCIHYLQSLKERFGESL